MFKPFFSILVTATPRSRIRVDVPPEPKGFLVRYNQHAGYHISTSMDNSNFSEVVFTETVEQARDVLESILKGDHPYGFLYFEISAIQVQKHTMTSETI